MPSTPVHTRELPCPTCGYDLRAAVESRCPECGTLARGAGLSHIPWVHRKYRGSVKAYLQTVWLVLRRPWMLAREAEHWVSRRAALRFHRASILLGTAIATALLFATFLLRSAKWIEGLAPRPERGDTPQGPFALPMYALMDRWWIVFPLCLSIYLSLVLSMFLYRRIVQFGSGSRRHRVRVGRLACYASALVPLEALLLGTLALIGMLTDEQRPWLPEYLAQLLLYAGIAGWLLVFASFYFSTISLIVRTGRLRLLRGVLMLPVYPYLVTTMSAGIAWLVFLAMGYAAIAIWSMTH